MESVVVVTPRHVSSASLRSWVESKGGYWINEELQQGVIEHGTGVVYIASYERFFDELDEAELASLEARLKQSPLGAVTFTISRARGSEDLTKTVVESFCNDWAGVRAVT